MATLTFVHTAGAVLGTLLIATSVAAQAPPPPEPPPRLETSAQFGFLSTTGNTSTQSLTLGGEVVYRPGIWLHSGKIAFAQNEDEDELKARSLDGRARTERRLLPRLSTYGQYAYLRDTFAGVEHRHTLEGGLSWVPIDRGAHRIRLDGAVGYEREVVLDAEDASSAAAIAGLGYRWRLSATSEFTEDVRVTLTIPEGDDWKADHQASLTAALTSVFSLRVTNVIRFVSTPVPTFERTDTVTSVSLVMKFRRAAS